LVIAIASECTKTAFYEMFDMENLDVIPRHYDG